MDGTAPSCRDTDRDPRWEEDGRRWLYGFHSWTPGPSLARRSRVENVERT